MRSVNHGMEYLVISCVCFIVQYLNIITLSVGHLKLSYDMCPDKLLLQVYILKSVRDTYKKHDRPSSEKLLNLYKYTIVRWVYLFYEAILC